MRQTHLCLALAGSIVCVGLLANTLSAQTTTLQAQKLVDRIAFKHPEISELEISTAREGHGDCETIAASKSKQIGEKCDEDEAAALRTLAPVIEEEPDEFDVTAPLHDAKGKLIGTLGIDFRPGVGKTKQEVLQRTRDLLRE